MSGDLVSIVIPVYNGMPTLPDAVGSALAQTHGDLEVVVIDNASTDGGSDWLRDQRDPRIRVVHRDTLQPAADNWDQAIAESRGAYVKLLCADDLIDPMALEHQVADLAAAPGAVMAAARRKVIDAGGRVMRERHGLGSLRGVVDGRAAVRYCCVAGTNVLGEPSAVLFRGEAIRGAMPWVPTWPYVIDLATYATVLRSGDVVCNPLVLASFRVSGTSWSSSLVGQQYAQFRAWRDALLASGEVRLGAAERARSDVNLRVRAFARQQYFRRAQRRSRS